MGCLRMFVQPAGKAHVTQRITVWIQTGKKLSSRVTAEHPTLSDCWQGFLDIMHLIFAIFYLYSLEYTVCNCHYIMTKTRINKNFVDPVAKTRACSFLESAGRQTPATSPVPSGLSATKRGNKELRTTRLRCWTPRWPAEKKISNPYMVRYLYDTFVLKAFDIPSSTTSFGPETTWSNVKCKRQATQWQHSVWWYFRSWTPDKVYAKFISIESIIKLKSFVWWYQPVFKMISTISSLKKPGSLGYLFWYIHRGWHPILPSALWIIIIHRFHICFWTKNFQTSKLISRSTLVVSPWAPRLFDSDCS